MSSLNRPSPPLEVAYAPGLRVETRDAEWVVKRADSTPNGSYSLLVTGISELVRGRDARFLTEIDQIDPLHPEETKLVPDDSPQFARSRLYLESLLRQSPPTSPDLFIGHKAAIGKKSTCSGWRPKPFATSLRRPLPRKSSPYFTALS